METVELELALTDRGSRVRTAEGREPTGGQRSPANEQKQVERASGFRETIALIHLSPSKSPSANQAHVMLLETYEALMKGALTILERTLCLQVTGGKFLI